jgi:neutral amino acid transport system permease protein
MAAFAPQLERRIFHHFREKGAELATMLIVTLGLAFVLRYTVQAYVGGTNRFYIVPDRGSVMGVDIPLSAAQHFDFYVTGGGLTLDWVNTAALGGDAEVVTVVGWSWPIAAGIVLLSIAAAAAAYWWRRRAIAGAGGATFRPWVVGSVAGVVVFFVVAALAAGGRAVPETSIGSTRIRLSLMRAVVVAIALVMMTFLHVLLKETKLGIAMRASSDNLDLAKVTGINTDRVMMATWIVAGAYAAVGGVMLGVLFSQIFPRMGFNLLLPMFAGVILGGVGSVYGAMLGSFLVGLSMDVGVLLLSLDVSYRVPIAFVVLFVVLLARPQGLTGGG